MALENKKLDRLFHAANFMLAVFQLSFSFVCDHLHASFALVLFLKLFMKMINILAIEEEGLPQSTISTIYFSVNLFSPVVSLRTLMSYKRDHLD